MDIDYSNISLNKPRENYPDGLFCGITYKNSSLIVDFPVNTIMNDVDFTYPKPNLFLNFIHPDLIKFNEQIKKTIIELVYQQGLFGRLSIQELGEMYCNPQKTIQLGKKFKETIKLKLAKKEQNILPKQTKVNVQVHITGVWFGPNSFGPCYNAINVKPVIDKCFITGEQSDSDIEI